MAANGEVTTTNKKVVLRRYVTGYPTAEDMEVVATPGIPLRAPRGSTDAVVVKNLYLSCDPWMRGRMTRHDDGDAVPADDFVLGEVCIYAHRPCAHTSSALAEFQCSYYLASVLNF
jgi:NADPH-dependent curcumin reductase CurA